ncbi:MAG TPA: FkbM family methyltransferase, partial [Catalimonadaceae bacterium]|nr:FkbM family methyltransferase [Catalimonadaceae bacterium]
INYWMRKNNYIDKQCFRESVTEDQYRLSSLVGKIDCVIDIGACQGIFAVRANAILKCPVYSFEPHPDNFKILTLNSQRKYPRIYPFEGAFVPRGMNKRVFLTSDGHEAANHLAEEGIPVLGWDYNDILGLIPGEERLLLKMDFEGGEDKAILEMIHSNYKTLHIVGEWHHDLNPVRQALIEAGCDNIEVEETGEVTGLFFATKVI